LAEQILTIAFDESGDIVIEQDGNRSKAVANHAKVQRDRLKVDSLKWITSASRARMLLETRRAEPNWSEP
jgi:hypothetical protein